MKLAGRLVDRTMGTVLFTVRPLLLERGDRDLIGRVAAESFENGERRSLRIAIFAVVVHAVVPDLLGPGVDGRILVVAVLERRILVVLKVAVPVDVDGASWHCLRLLELLGLDRERNERERGHESRNQTLGLHDLAPWGISSPSGCEARGKSLCLSATPTLGLTFGTLNDENSSIMVLLRERLFRALGRIMDLSGSKSPFSPRRR